MIDLNDDAQVLAATLFGEARGEGLNGIRAVAAAVANRMRVASLKGRKQFGDGSARSACLAPWQFSCWNENSPERAMLLALDFKANPLSLDDFVQIATQAIDGTLPDTTNGACFYKVTTLPWPIDWGKPEQPCAVIGHHSFFHLGVTVPPKPQPPLPPAAIAAVPESDPSLPKAA